MGRGKTAYLSYTALVLLSTVSTSIAATTTTSTSTPGGLWHISIDETPAPLPKNGPPFSANASRNPALLPYQIIGVVGAYVGSVLIIGSLLLTVGRSHRKRALRMATEPREMVKPLTKTLETSPESFNDRPWFSPRRLKYKVSQASSLRSGPSNTASPEMASVAGFDNSVVEADRIKRQREMERLYAAVMASDEHRSASGQNVTALPPLTPDGPPEYSRRNVPNTSTQAQGLQRLQATDWATEDPSTPRTPKTPVRAIYPPYSNIPPGPASPTSPIRAEYPPWAERSQLAPRTGHSRDPSYGSGRTSVTATSDSSQKPKRQRKSVRALKISGPIVRTDDNSDGARTPLSPRFYSDPGIPPEPPTAGTQRSFGYPPTTPGTDGGFGEAEEGIDVVRDLPQPNPQRLSAHNYLNQAQMLTNLASSRPDPTKSRAVGDGSLPLREMNRQYAQQTTQQAQQGQYVVKSAYTEAFPLSPGTWNTTSPRAYNTSAGPVKTTFLEAPKDKSGAPLTGMPTPYSAYMPYTPVTPVTPSLTTRAQRKQREKEERKTRQPITEEDAVAEESELWSSGY